MLLTEYVFVPRVDSPEHKSALVDAAQGLFAALWKNGQVWGQEVPGWVDGALRVMCIVPRPDALAPQHHCRQGVIELERATGLCAQSPSWRVLDDRAKQLIPAHPLQKSTALYLFTTLLDATSPVRDGAEGQPIPLYLLPIDEQVREALCFWMKRYEAMDRLFIGSSTLEIEAYRELADPASDLAQQGRRLTTTLEIATKLPTYYYLTRYWGRRQGEAERLCPGCGRAWAVKQNAGRHGLERFGFRCEPCRLVSDTADSVEDERHARIGERSRVKQRN